MDRRLDLHNILTSIEGLNGVHYQPPSNVRLVYPCIVYSLAGREIRYADNGKYVAMSRFTVSLITRDPDDPKRQSLEDIRHSSFDRAYTADNLHHFVYTIYH